MKEFGRKNKNVRDWNIWQAYDWTPSLSIQPCWLGENKGIMVIPPFNWKFYFKNYGGIWEKEKNIRNFPPQILNPNATLK